MIDAANVGSVAAEVAYWKRMSELWEALATGYAVKAPGIVSYTQKQINELKDSGGPQQFAGQRITELTALRNRLDLAVMEIRSIFTALEQV